MSNSFTAQIETARKKYEKRMVLIHKKVSADLFRKVIVMTPVDTGRAKGNWMLGINAIPQEVSEDVDKSETGEKTVAKVITGLESLRTGDTAVLANSLPYIVKLEYGGFPNPPLKGSYDKKTKSYIIKSAGGYSKQAPTGMVRTAIEEYRPILNKAIALAKRETP